MIFPKFRLPDRTLGLLSRPDQEKLPTLLQHQHYCELLQRTICTALSTLKLYSSPTSTHLPILLSTLVSVHPEHLCSHLWEFLAAFASTSSDFATLTSAIISSLDSTSSEKVGRRRRCPLLKKQAQQLFPGAPIRPQLKAQCFPAQCTPWKPPN